MTLRRRRPAGAETAELVWLTREGDGLARVLAAFALGRSVGERVNETLTELLDDADSNMREAAMLAFLERPAYRSAFAPLLSEQEAGGFAGMLAGLVLDEWLSPEEVGRPQDTSTRSSKATGLRLAQVFLQGKLDGGLQRAGDGDGGGIATLLVHLSRELGRRPSIGHVTTISRAFVDEDLEVSSRNHESLGPNASIKRISFGPSHYLATPEMWAHRREVERELERTFNEIGGLDAVHLRFADVGTLAAARVARRMGIPIVFTLAPDPHGVIRERERTGHLTRESFLEANSREHFLFRAWLVETLLEQSSRLVLFPRANAKREVRELLGIDEQQLSSGRFRTVPEGISLANIDRANDAITTQEASPALRDLDTALRALPPKRAGLPLVLSVGRFHSVKGFPRLVEAWASDRELQQAFNLVIVGGNLNAPTAEEQRVLHSVGDVVDRIPHAADGLVLLGHRSHSEVAQLLHATRRGRAELVGQAGVYACASEKEEFGLALLEALAAGLPVVAPERGGPPTYIDDGVTGALVDTTSVESIVYGLRRAAAVREDETRAKRAGSLIRERFSVEAMAAELGDLYSGLLEVPAHADAA